MVINSRTILDLEFSTYSQFKIEFFVFIAFHYPE